jgi:uncharacterized protein (TIGR02001 family)
MKIKAIILFSCLVFINSIIAQETDKDNNALSAECAFTPKYVWRGITYTDGLAIQPSIAFAQNQFTIQFWGNLVGKDKNDLPGNEFDIYLTYDYNLWGFTISPAVYYYMYPGQEVNSTAEFNFGLSYTIGDFTFGTAIAKDIIEVSHSVFGYHDIKYANQLSEKLAFNLSAGLGWGNSQFNTYYIGLEKAALNYAVVAGSLSYSVSEKLSIKPYFENYFLLDPDLKELRGNTNFNFGVSLGLEL